MRVVITGASSGIGAEIARQFADDGAELILSWRSNIKNLEAFIKERDQNKIDHYFLDLADPRSIYAFAQKVLRGGRIDVLINNAGTISWKAFDEMAPEEIGYLIQVNLIGVMQLTQMLARSVNLRIINVASDVGSKPHSGLVPYSAAKAGIINMTRSLAELYTGIKVLCVSPDATRTQMNDISDEQQKLRDPKFVANVIYKAAMGDYNGYRSGHELNFKDMFN
ncbi:MAG: SDR family oxidoreductase [Candidatus Doudnabacteria bacterium]|nr:SDR family oxidoreductase [Candidatus Doudnabacteria bacterium]